MKIKNYTFLLIVCALLFSACENPKVENTSLSLNKAENNQNVANSISSNANNSVSEDTNDKVDVEANTNDKAEFAGTAGITDKKNDIKSVAVLKEVRAARHGNYDRVVFEFEGAELPGYHIEYIDKPVRACGSGNVVPLEGDGWLEIRFYPAQAHDESGQPTIKNREQNPNFQIIKEMKSICDFEADVTWVLGVSSPNEYRVLELKNPTRLAVDIKH
ncbi:hypothetical protein BH24ACI2_BH24ACI2_09440 [soil metagenome]|jgi:hypothetical protein|nr:hypothetical protein [Acidobacteriota bacterium]